MKPENQSATVSPDQSASWPRPALWMALLPILVLIALLSVNVYLYGADSSYGPNQIALLLATGVAGLMGMLLKIPFKHMAAGIQTSIQTSLIAMMILLLIGALTGTWMISGIVPAMIYYGLGVLSPETFLCASAIICAIVSVVTGSSWSTVATIGIALLGIGNVLGVYEGYTAGAIISGAYFGDKISPLSDTTNLAAAMAGTELITHIKYMLWTTIPSFLIALGIFLAMGLMAEVPEASASTDALKQEIASRFNLNPIIFVVPAVVLLLVLLKVDALVALFVGAFAGGLMAVAVQPSVVSDVAGLEGTTVTVVDADGNERSEFVEPPYAQKAYIAFVNSLSIQTRVISKKQAEGLQKRANELSKLIEDNPPSESVSDDARGGGAANNGLILQSQLEQINAQIATAELLQGKGMTGMLNTVWLIITAMCFGGMMEACGLLKRLTDPLVELAGSTGSLVTTTAGSCVFFNLTASDQYLAIVVPGRMFRETFRERGLAPQNLSRTLEDAGTVTSVLIPWNTCGAAQRSVLGVSVFVFAPYCFFNILSPVMTLLFAWLGLGIAKLDDAEDDGMGGATEVQVKGT